MNIVVLGLNAHNLGCHKKQMQEVANVSGFADFVQHVILDSASQPALLEFAELQVPLYYC